MGHAVLVVMVLAMGDVLSIAHCHLLTPVPGVEDRCVSDHRER